MKKISVILVLIALFGLFFLAGRNSLFEIEKAPQSENAAFKDDIRIIVATDLHYLAERCNDGGEYFIKMVESSDGKSTEYCVEIIDALINDVIAKNPDALVLSGDISFNGEKYSHEELAEKLKKIKKAGIPVFVLPGNHDLYNDRAYAFSGKYIYGVENIDDKTFEEIYKEFGYKNALFKDDNSLSYVQKIRDDFWILFVDTNTKRYPGGILPETLDFVENVLKEAKQSGAEVISVTHQNLLKHHPDIYKGYSIEDGKKLLSLYEKYGCKLNLSGHIHMQHVAENMGVTEIVTSSIMLYPIRYGILDFNNEEISYKSESVSIEDEAFWERTRELLQKPIYERVLEEIKDEEVATWFSDSNIYYFTGRPDLIEWNEELYEKAFPEGGRTERYFSRMKDEPKLDYTRREISK